MLHATSHPAPHAPSRRDNPFATCWTRPGALLFQFPPNESADQLVTNLAAQQWRGAIIGPHGSGKSTLLETIKPAITATGRTIRSIQLHDGQRRLSRNFLSATENCEAANTLIIIDGYEQLAWPARLDLWFHCRTSRNGLLITSHYPVCIPTLIHLAPNRELITQLVTDLGSEVSTTITPVDVAASHACHGSNVREILSDLYDLHETRRRAANLAAAVS